MMAWAPRVKKAERRKRSETKPAWSKLYNDRRWKEASRRHRADSPLCVECLKHGATVAAEAVDHIRPHRGNLETFWDAENWQSLCGKCHAAKSAGERTGGG